MPPEGPAAGPDDRARFEHMLDAARDGISFVRGRSRADLDTDRMLRRALVNAIQEIGEAAARTTQAGRARLPSVEWSLVVKMRNILVHVYWGVEFDYLWQTATEDLPVLIRSLEATLAAWSETSGEE